jgi:hypothetical protein
VRALRAPATHTRTLALPLSHLALPAHRTRRHINLYVDDTGAMKGLPDNTRAAGLAAAAGHPCDVHGDAFVARVVDCEEEFDRQDFTLKEARCATQPSHLLRVGVCIDAPARHCA